jgi:COP9 signalosome complex subunit 3
VPRTINANTLKTVKAASKAYDALAEAFTQVNNTAKLKALINAGLDTWAEVNV